MAKINRTTTQAKDQQLIAGIKADLQTMPTLYLGGTTYTPKTLTALIQSRIDQANEVATDKAEWQNSGKTYETLNTSVNVVVHDLKQLVISTFGADSPKLADFGFVPKKQVVRTTESKTKAVAQAKATRVARGTKGPKAKLAIKGTVATTQPVTVATPAVTLVTPTAPAAASTPAPATVSTPAPASQVPAVTAFVTPAAAVASPAPASGSSTSQAAQPVVASTQATPEVQTAAKSS